MLPPPLLPILATQISNRTYHEIQLDYPDLFLREICLSPDVVVAAILVAVVAAREAAAAAGLPITSRPLTVLLLPLSIILHTKFHHNTPISPNIRLVLLVHDLVRVVAPILAPNVGAILAPILTLTPSPNMTPHLAPSSGVIMVLSLVHLPPGQWPDWRIPRRDPFQRFLKPHFLCFPEPTRSGPLPRTNGNKRRQQGLQARKGIGNTISSLSPPSVCRRAIRMPRSDEGMITFKSVGSYPTHSLGDVRYLLVLTVLSVENMGSISPFRGCFANKSHRPDKGYSCIVEKG